MKVKTILDRLKSDFFLQDRSSEYDRILKKAIERGYRIVSHSEYFKLVKQGLHVGKKILILRQDIDSDPRYVLKWLEIQHRFGLHSSFYFRKCTFNKKVMQAVIASGSDCGYHYEEIADYAKRHNLTKREMVLDRISDIREEFKKNLIQFEENLGSKIKHVASHGDFANRLLDLPNRFLITPELLQECGLEFEAYQSEFVDTYSINISDCGYPTFFKGKVTVLEAIESEVPIIHFLMHPKHWRSNWYWNLYENGKRFIEGIKFK